MQPAVFIVVLNWNSGQDSLACIKSIETATYPNNRVVVVDNGSTDGSPEKIAQLFPGVKIIRHQKNLGYTGGNNTGILYSMEKGADYVWLLNNDTEIAPDCIHQLVARAERQPAAGLLSPVVYYAEQPRIIQFAKEQISLSNMEKSSGGNLRIQADDHVVDHLPGTAMLIKRAVVEKIGLLRDELFAYWEDTDYCIRAAKAGFENVVVESAAVFHKHQLKTGDGNWKSPHFYYYMLRNKILLGRYHFKSKKERIRYLLYCMFKAADIVGNMNSEYARCYLNGLWHGLIGVTGQMSFEKPVPKPLYFFFLAFSKCHPAFIWALLSGDLASVSGKINNFAGRVKA
jgi:GT2 family glycosyltransferase